MVYADDIVCCWKDMHEIVTAIEVMKEWCIVNRMIVNPSKSGILRILNRKGKTPGIVNPLNIPEVDKYNYLGIAITQSLKLHDHEIKLRITEKYLGARINILASYIKNTKVKKLLYKALVKSKWIYWIETLTVHDNKYKEKLESIW